MSIAALVPILGPAIDKLLSFIPDPEQKARARAEFERQLLDQETAFRDFVVAYEGRGDQVHPALQVYRGSVRPTITYALAGAFIWGFAQPDVFQKETMTLLFQLNLVSLGFWYGSRTLERLGLDLGSFGKAGRTALKG